ncbi:MAG: hypothetical protein J6P05_04845 [Lachnospiraceae bacterium]|nr:hypothetical protein [Lachnospiraceae bacterium]
MKNKLFQKLLVAAAAAGLALSMTACGSSSSSTNNAPANEAENTEPAAEAEKASEPAAANSGTDAAAQTEEEDSEDEDEDEDDTMLVISDDADESLIVNQNYEQESKPLESDKAGDLQATRLKFHQTDEEGDEEAVQEDMEEYEGIEAPKDWQLSQLKENYDELGELFTKYGITVYDFNAPNYSAEDELDYDVYTDNASRFDILTLYDADHNLEEINIMEY